MKKSISYILMALLSLSVWAQNSTEDDPIQTYSQTIKADDMKAHLYFLADDLLEGRETGERGQHLAGIYIRSQFMRLGLQPGNTENQTYFQKFFLNRSETRDAAIRIGKENFSFGEDFIATGGMPDEIEADMVFAGLGISDSSYDNLSQVDVSGKVAIILSGQHKEMENENRYQSIRQLRERKDKLVEMGAKAVIIGVPDSTYRILNRYSRRPRSIISPNQERGFPLFYFQDETLAEILTKGKKTMPKLREKLAENDKLPKNKLKNKRFALEAEVDFESKEASNVLGFLEGTDKKDELLIITAHYDHVGIGRNGRVYNGADDDGSGTTAILELAEAFATAARDGVRPRRSILFMTVSGEEKGLLGSKFYTDYPIYPLENTVSNLNIDMIGRIDKRYEDKDDQNEYVYLIGSDKLSTELHELSEEANETYAKLTLDYKYNDENDPNRFYYRSDHYNFAKNGIPIIFYFNGTHEDYHQPGDDPEKIAYQKMENITRLVFATAWKVANREQRITVDVVDQGN